MWELSSPTRDGTQAPTLAMQSLTHWFAREVPLGVFFFFNPFQNEAQCGGLYQSDACDNSPSPTLGTAGSGADLV